MFNITANLLFDNKYTMPQKCVVDKIITISDADFKKLNENLLEDHDFIREHNEIINNANRNEKEDLYHCLLYVPFNGNDGLLVSCEGHDYARYSAYIPCAKQIEQVIEQQDSIKLENERLFEIYDFTPCKFFLNDDSVERIYFNPDADAGGQFVSDTVSLVALINAFATSNNSDEFWEYFDSHAEQYLTDIDTTEFASVAEEYAMSPYDFEGENKKTMNGLREWVFQQQANQTLSQETDMNMG